MMARLPLVRYHVTRPQTTAGGRVRTRYVEMIPTRPITPGETACN